MLGHSMTPDFKVRFGGGRGRCLTYEDGSGTLIFGFDFAMPDGKRMIIYKAGMTGDLKRIPPVLSEAEQSRLQLAFERVKQYAVSCGHKLCENDVA
jgi:hypothetical protein